MSDLAERPADWDPKEVERELVRHRVTGDLGYLVKRSGKVMVRLDRPAQEILRKHDADWIEEERQLPLAQIHVARVAFEADRALCAALSMHEHARKTWNQLSDPERHAWIAKGPVAPIERRALYRHVREALEPFTRE